MRDELTRRQVDLSGAVTRDTPNRFAVILLDMPFAALDKPSIRFVLDLLQNAADHPDRACVLADYVAPDGVRLANVIDLGD